MPNKDIFCNAPWYELQIYWDGGLGFCCQEQHRIYHVDYAQQYNVKNMTIAEWFNSEPMKQARLAMFGDQLNSICTRCYYEEDHSSTSRRHRCNQKSVIFTRTAFNSSYLQSPGLDKFEHSRLHNGDFSGLPIDLHIDLGNYCNLTCKMCKPQASSSIAVQYVKWGIDHARPYIGNDWTRDETTWNRVLDELINIPNLKNIHFMGGETLITPKFENFVDYMLDHGRTDLHFSFVTNGTIFNLSLLEKLKKFQRVGIEVSIETITDHNSYQRQGTDTNQVLKNIQKYLDHCNGSTITLTVRPALSLLTIGYYHTLLRFCLENQLIVKSLAVTAPSYLEIKVLPEHIKKLYAQHYYQLFKEFNMDSIDCDIDYNESDPNQILRIIKNQIQQCLNFLKVPCPNNSDELLNELVSWCRRWDDIHGYNALDLYPEMSQEFISRGY